MSGNGSADAAAGTGDRLESRDPKPWFTVASGVIGLLLIGFAWFAKRQDPAFAYQNMLFCVGLALILAGTGAAAFVRYKAISAGGAVAIAIAITQLFKPDPPPEQYVLGLIDGTQNLPEFTIQGSNPLLVGRKTVTDKYRFMAENNDLQDDTFFIQFVDKGQTFQIGCLARSLLLNNFHYPHHVEFSLVAGQQPTPWRLFVNNQEVGRLGQQTCVSTPSPLPKFSRWLRWLPDLLPRAFAQDAAGPTQNVPAAVQQLKSDDIGLRAAAQYRLGKISSLDDFAQFAQAWDVGSSDSFSDLGAVVGMSTALRRDPAAALKLTRVLQPDQIQHIITLTGYPDLTMRENAAETLGDLLSAQTNDPALGAARTRLFGAVKTALAAVGPGFAGSFPSDPAAKAANPRNLTYNLLLALDYSRCRMQPTERAALQTPLQELKQRWLAPQGQVETIKLTDRFGSGVC